MVAGPGTGPDRLTTGRIYGHLLLHSAPASLDSLGKALGLSKGAVSTSVRELGRRYHDANQSVTITGGPLPPRMGRPAQ
ncbi:hypothetical protein [Micromonospora sp. NPDC051296]|uniref:hypothetical protein n=1 Tax=Micromonospora sp. NPDC051296 TaxID=3155046 RepID=UPI00344558A8